MLQNTFVPITPLPDIFEKNEALSEARLKRKPLLSARMVNPATRSICIDDNNTVNVFLLRVSDAAEIIPTVRGIKSETTPKTEYIPNTIFIPILIPTDQSNILSMYFSESILNPFYILQHQENYHFLIICNFTVLSPFTKVNMLVPGTRVSSLSKKPLCPLVTDTPFMKRGLSSLKRPLKSTV